MQNKDDILNFKNQTLQNNQHEMAIYQSNLLNRRMTKKQKKIEGTIEPKQSQPLNSKPEVQKLNNDILQKFYCQSP